MLSLANAMAIRAVTSGDGDERLGELIAVDRPTGLRLRGIVLEAAVQCDAGFLLFLTDDVPYEDTLSIHLIAPTFALLDSARIGAAYATGSFRELRLQQPDTVEFRFVGDTRWSVRLLEVRSLRVPFMGDPVGVHRPFGFARRFVIDGSPLPAAG